MSVSGRVSYRLSRPGICRHALGIMAGRREDVAAVAVVVNVDVDVAVAVGEIAVAEGMIKLRRWWVLITVAIVRLSMLIRVGVR